jgi:hypothetical protein
MKPAERPARASTREDDDAAVEPAPNESAPATDDALTRLLKPMRDAAEERGKPTPERVGVRDGLTDGR